MHAAAARLDGATVHAETYTPLPAGPSLDALHRLAVTKGVDVSRHADIVHKAHASASPNATLDDLLHHVASAVRAREDALRPRPHDRSARIWSLLDARDRNNDSLDG